MWGGGRRALWLALLLACTDHTVGHRSLLGSVRGSPLPSTQDQLSHSQKPAMYGIVLLCVRFRWMQRFGPHTASRCRSL
jgi:hypothetical protein